MPVSIVECCDCMDFMSKYPDKFFELAVVDPPYGIGEDGRNNHTRGCFAKSKDYRINARYDNDTPTADYFDELNRVSVNQIIWGGNFFIDYLQSTPCMIVWDKLNGETDFADCEIAYTSFDTAVRKFSFRWQGMLQGNMKAKQERIHPNEKPFQLYSWLLKNYAKPGDKILDTHLGSGSSRIAAYKLGFDFYGCEIDPDYYEQAEKRFKKAIAEPLFDIPQPHQQTIFNNQK